MHGNNPKNGMGQSGFYVGTPSPNPNGPGPSNGGIGSQGNQRVTINVYCDQANFFSITPPLEEVNSFLPGGGNSNVQFNSVPMNPSRTVRFSSYQTHQSGEVPSSTGSPPVHPGAARKTGMNGHRGSPPP